MYMVKGGIIAVKGVKILGDCAYVLSSSKRGDCWVECVLELPKVVI